MKKVIIFRDGKVVDESNNWAPSMNYMQGDFMYYRAVNGHVTWFDMPHSLWEICTDIPKPILLLALLMP